MPSLTFPVQGEETTRLPSSPLMEEKKGGVREIRKGGKNERM
jgi:hypothetical protein